MRTKTLLLTAAFGAAGLATSMAQEVFSVNAVGYVNMDLPAGFSMIANPLNQGDNSLSTILPEVPDGVQLLKWDAANQTFADANAFIGGVGWIPDGTLNPGEGAFINVPAGGATLTFVGEVPQGDLSLAIPANFSIVSQLTPQEEGIGSPGEGLGFPAEDGDQVLFWDSASQSYEDPIAFIGGGVGWIPAEPTPAVGESFFVNKAVAGTWNRTFSVNDND